MFYLLLRMKLSMGQEAVIYKIASVLRRRHVELRDPNIKITVLKHGG